tara:strand:- start:909 stop:1088 length:180 start_codon:yes stop_codon:yes gene_type:complete
MQTDLTRADLLTLYSAVTIELSNLEFSDFTGCEAAMIANHQVAAKLLTLIIQARASNDD